MVKSHKKRPGSPTTDSPQKSNKDRAVIDGDDLPARLAASVNVNGQEGMGEFEDAWEDDFENEAEEGIVHLNEDSDDGDESVEDNIPGAGKPDGVDDLQVEGEAGPSRSPSPTPYLPHLDGSTLAKDEELVADASTYLMLHNMSLNWPCLSFDILRDDHGEERRKYPHSACVVAGTQAGHGYVDNDELVVMKWEGLCKTQQRELGDEDSDDDDDDDDEDNAAEDDPVLTYRTIPHKGCVNRVRARPITMPYSTKPPQPPLPYHVATFSELGKVHIYDVAPHLQSLQDPGSVAASNLPKTPVYTIQSHHGAEGFALAWGPQHGSSSSARLLSGDIHSKIYLTTLTPSNFTPSTQPFTSHTSSVEDIQWSPNELTVFASCSADQSLRVWDVRVKDRRSVIGIESAHDSDINVLSWNATTNYLLATGGDEGAIKVWDLRSFKGAQQPRPTPVASFSWHKGPITSIEWHPTEDSCFAASGADDQVTLWDLSVEADDEAITTTARKSGGATDRLKDVPAQLLFCHQGQKDVKEIHWHPQIPGTVISTALDGFNVLSLFPVSNQ